MWQRTRGWQAASWPLVTPSGRRQPRGAGAVRPAPSALALLSRAVENATISSYGRQYPAVFWLQHSLDISRLLKETPKRILRQDTEVGRRYVQNALGVAAVNARSLRA